MLIRTVPTHTLNPLLFRPSVKRARVDEGPAFRSEASEWGNVRARSDRGICSALSAGTRNCLLLPPLENLSEKRRFSRLVAQPRVPKYVLPLRILVWSALGGWKIFMDLHLQMTRNRCGIHSRRSGIHPGSIRHGHETCWVEDRRGIKTVPLPIPLPLISLCFNKVEEEEELRVFLMGSSFFRLE